MSASPFIPGTRYRVLADTEELGHAFQRGSTVVFVNSAYDPHNGVTRFWFRREGSDELNAWHVWDTDPPATEQSMGIFERRLDEGALGDCPSAGDEPPTLKP